MIRPSDPGVHSKTCCFLDAVWRLARRPEAGA